MSFFVTLCVLFLLRKNKQKQKMKHTTEEDENKTEPNKIRILPCGSILKDDKTYSLEDLEKTLAKNEARYHCANCKDVAYCSEECQKQDWDAHKESCYF